MVPFSCAMFNDRLGGELVVIANAPVIIGLRVLVCHSLVLFVFLDSFFWSFIYHSQDRLGINGWPCWLFIYLFIYSFLFLIINDNSTFQWK
jgi:hypothetical protein